MITCSTGDACHYILALNRQKIDLGTLFLTINGGKVDKDLTYLVGCA